MFHRSISLGLLVLGLTPVAIAHNRAADRVPAIDLRDEPTAHESVQPFQVFSADLLEVARIEPPAPSIADALACRFAAKEKLASGVLLLRDENNIKESSELSAKWRWGVAYGALPFIEPATGLVYARARWYDPQTGTFLTDDPSGYTDSSNLYAYAKNDPVNLSDPTGEVVPILAYLGWTAVNTGVDVLTDWAFHEVGDWWNGTDTEFDWHDSLQTNFSINLVTGGIGGKLKKAKRVADLLSNPVARNAISEGIEFGADVAATGTIDMAYHNRSAADAYGSALVGGLTGRTISHGGAKFRDMFVGARRAFHPDSTWNLGQATRGEVIERQLGHNLPGSFPTIDRFDPISGHATSIKSLDLTLKTTNDPKAFGRLLRGYVDKVADFPTRTVRRKGVVIRPKDVMTRSLDIAVEPGAASWMQSLALRRARRYGEQHGVDVRIIRTD